MPISSADTARPTPRLVIQGLSAGYGRDPIISDIDLVVGDGEVVSVIGANGAGKSTLLKTITGALSTMSGQVATSPRLATCLTR